MSKRSASPATPRRKRVTADTLAPDTLVDPEDARTDEGHMRPHRWITLRMHPLPFTKHNFVQACHYIEQCDYFPGLRCEPDDAFEGGIRLVDPANPRAYKTVRLVPGNRKWSKVGNTDAWRREWKASIDVVMEHQDGSFDLLCKSNYYAAPWRNIELSSIAAAFVNTGVFLPARKSKGTPHPDPASSMPKKHPLEAAAVSEPKKPALETPAAPAPKPAAVAPAPAAASSSSSLTVSTPKPAAVTPAPAPDRIPSATEMRRKLDEQRAKRKSELTATANQIVATQAEYFEERIAEPAAWNAANTVNLFSSFDIPHHDFPWHEMRNALLDALAQRYKDSGYLFCCDNTSFQMYIPLPKYN